MNNDTLDEDTSREEQWAAFILSQPSDDSDDKEKPHKSSQAKTNDNINEDQGKIAAILITLLRAVKTQKTSVLHDVSKPNLSFLERDYRADHTPALSRSASYTQTHNM